MAAAAATTAAAAAARRRTRSRTEGGSSSGDAPNPNPLAFLGLRRVGEQDDDFDEQQNQDESNMEGSSGIELNRRGLPARKRKKNSLIYGQDDLVSIPVKSPKKKGSRQLDDTGQRDRDRRKELSALRDKERLLRRASGVASALTESKSAPPTPDKKTRQREPKTSSSTPSSPRKPSSRVAAAISSSTSSMPASPAGGSSCGVIAKRRIAHTLKSPEKSPTKSRRAAAMAALAQDDLELTSPEKKVAQSLGVALRNLLKLPKAHKWVCYEFFYSNLDKVLFEGENDFCVCLRESFPLLKTRRLTRVEWCKVRRLMGKPRRCSQAFFDEERIELGRKRAKIRLLQQRKQGDAMSLKDLPDEIPLQLTIGARVTARLRQPQDGLFTGTVDAYDTSNNTYRITFDRTGLGTHSIPDYEVLATGDAETVPLSTFTTKARPRPVPQPTSIESPMPLGGSPMRYVSAYSPGIVNDPLLSGSTPKGKIINLDGQLGGYPVRFLDQLVRLSKCLRRKREKVESLRQLNSDGEMQKSFGEFITEDFQRRYASTVLDLAHINRDLNEHLEVIREHTTQFSNEAGPTISLPNIIRESCQEDAYNLVNKSNISSTSAKPNSEIVESPKMLALISSLTALLIQVKHLADGEKNAFEMEALQQSLSEIKQNLHPENRGCFSNSVEVHMQHILSGLTQMGNLTAFMKQPNQGQAAVKAEFKTG